MQVPATAAVGLRLVRPGRLLRTAWRLNPALTLVGTLMLVVLAGTAVGLVLDPRVITGVPAWLKPAKFAISISIYSFTLLWLLTFVRGRRRLVRLISVATALALGIEMALIAGAAALGTTSHFNVSTPAHTAVWSTMAVFIVITWLMNLVAIVLLLIQRLPDRAFAWALRWGLIISSVGMAVAFLMTQPTPEQRSAAEATGAMPVAGAHAVGVQDGGPGLPLTNWSTTGGDLRVSHFVGLHALQLLPLIGYAVTRLGRGRLASGHQVALVWTVALAYLGLVVVLTSQALRGQSVVAPDAVTLAAAGVLALAAGAAVTAVLLHARVASRS